MTASEVARRTTLEAEKIRLEIIKLKIEKEKLRHMNILEEITAMKNADIKALVRGDVGGDEAAAGVNTLHSLHSSDKSAPLKVRANARTRGKVVDGEKSLGSPGDVSERKQ